MRKPAPKLVKAKLHEIDVRYGTARAERTSGCRAVFRVAEIDRLVVARYGRELPDDDAGRDDVRLMVHHLAQISGDAHRRITTWIAKRAPWMSPLDAGRLTDAALAKPLRWRAEKLGEAFRLTDVERTELKIRTIAAIDITPAELAERRKQHDRDRKAAARRAGGAQQRNQYEACSMGHGKPWITAGVSRSTWYRRQSERVVS
jgi:hypothetical protein